MKRLAGLLALLLTVSIAVPAFADDDSDAPVWKSHEAPRARWYGWQTLAVDGIGLALAAGAGQMDDSGGGARTLGFTALGLYALGGPVVHAAHDRWGTALGSLALRAALPATVGGIAYGLASAGGDCKDGFFGCEIFGVLGAVIGIGGAIAIDSAVLARETVPPANEARVAPSIAPRREGGVTFGLSGTF